VTTPRLQRDDSFLHVLPMLRTFNPPLVLTEEQVQAELAGLMLPYFQYDWGDDDIA
jgi:hypothetical protein